jgi:hypothetical protein
MVGSLFGGFGSADDADERALQRVDLDRSGATSIGIASGPITTSGAARNAARNRYALHDDTLCS